MTDVTLSEHEQETINKYKTLARAIVANDAEACRLIHSVYETSGKKLDVDEINALGLRWLMNKKAEAYNIDVGMFLKEIGFDFEQLVVFDQENENSGTSIPFRLIEGEPQQNLLIALLENDIVPLDASDGMGDNLIVEAVQKQQFDLADRLLQLGVDLGNLNMAGQTALHVSASKANFGACKWLCENNIDPTVEDLIGARASEMVPETMGGWDVDCLFEALEQYVEDYRQGQAFQSSPNLDAMAQKEKGEESDVDDNQTLGQQADEAQSILISLGP